MSKKRTTELLVESGILPRGGVAQLERHKMVPQGTVDRLGIRPVSLDRDSAEARGFADKLQKKLDEEETEIRQQNLTPGVPIQAWLKWGEGPIDPQPTEVLVDKLGRVYLPIQLLGNGQKKRIKAIRFQEGTPETPVDHTELLYEGTTLKYLVCALRRRQ